MSQSLKLTLRRGDGCGNREQALTELCKDKPWASEEKITVSFTTSNLIDNEGICPTGESNSLAKMTHYGSFPSFNITMATFDKSHLLFPSSHLPNASYCFWNKIPTLDYGLEGCTGPNPYHSQGNLKSVLPF